MRYKLTYVYGDSDQKFTQTFSSKVLMESYIETGKDKDLRVINIESSKLYGYARVSSKEQMSFKPLAGLKAVCSSSSSASSMRRYWSSIRKKPMPV